MTETIDYDRIGNLFADKAQVIVDESIRQHAQDCRDNGTYVMPRTCDAQRNGLRRELKGDIRDARPPAPPAAVTPADPATPHSPGNNGDPPPTVKGEVRFEHFSKHRTKYLVAIILIEFILFIMALAGITLM